jgi:ABC-type nitrate/sulfonate/bicarbonate transport system ATPase subunit
VLDDIFGSLDSNTSAQVMERLLGTHGILRRENVTVVLATHASKTSKPTHFDGY